MNEQGLELIRTRRVVRTLTDAPVTREQLETILRAAAHALELGAGPVTSFSRAAVAAALNLPDGLRPELLVCLGHPAETQAAPMASQHTRRWRDVTHWGRY